MVFDTFYCFTSTWYNQELAPSWSGREVAEGAGYSHKSSSQMLFQKSELIEMRLVKVSVQSSVHLPIVLFW